MPAVGCGTDVLSLIAEPLTGSRVWYRRAQSGRRTTYRQSGAVHRITWSLGYFLFICFIYSFYSRYKNGVLYPVKQLDHLSRKCVMPLSRSDQPPALHNAALSRRRTENKPPSDHNATPDENNPHPPFHKLELLSSLYSCILYYYLYLLCFIVFYLTPVLIRFVKLCVCRDLYTTRAHLMMANTGRNM